MAATVLPYRSTSNAAAPESGRATVSSESTERASAIARDLALSTIVLGLARGLHRAAVLEADAGEAVLFEQLPADVAELFRWRAECAVRALSPARHVLAVSEARRLFPDVDVEAVQAAYEAALRAPRA